MADDNKIDNFELPRTDWYDSKGRINKDALIENFNAVEAKCAELNELDVANAVKVNTDEVDYEDVTLDSDDRKVVNLNSFLNIMQLREFPFYVEFNGTKLVKLMYYDLNGNLTTLENVKTGANSIEKYVFIEFGNSAGENDKINISSTFLVNQTLIGCYCDGSIHGMYNQNYCNIDFLQYLSRMSRETRSLTVSAGNREKHGYGNPGSPVNTYDGTRIMGNCDSNKKTRESYEVTFCDVGRDARTRDDEF